MRVEVFARGSDAARSAAELLARVLRRRGDSVVLLPVGKTSTPVYRELARLHAAGRAPFRRATTFNLDELRVPPGDPRSFRSFMETHLFSKVDVDRRRIRFLRGDAPDPERECARYERQLAREGPPDVAFVGIGVNGHVAYLEPARSLPPATARVRLSSSTRQGLAAAGVRPAPREALTVGIETILSSHEIVLVAIGRKKAAAVAAALEGPVTPQCPASFLSLHPALRVLLDRPAAARLGSR
ncbi:MAG TPA: glucosamine-6-phosphate deaminase [Thermoanaerobaculia bacterium]